MLTLDIETVPLTAALAVPFDPNTVAVPANYKSADAIENFKAKAAAEYGERRVKECSLNPRLGRVLTIGYKLDDDGVQTLHAYEEKHEDNIVRVLWGLLAHAKHPLVTWNGTFDLRFLAIRSLAHGIYPPIVLSPYFKRYSLHPHFDCKAALLQEWGSKIAGEGLDEWAKFFGLPSKSHDGSQVYRLFQEGQHDEIRAYCAQDVELTASIYARIHPMF